jgi:hypothetical protein
MRASAVGSELTLIQGINVYQEDNSSQEAADYASDSRVHIFEHGL